MSEKPMRELMPECAALVDAFREAGLTDNTTIAQGLRDGSCWFAEGGHYIGKPGAREAAERRHEQAVGGDELDVLTAEERKVIAAIRNRGRKGRES